MQMQHWFREDQDPFAEFDGRRRPARQPDDAGWAVNTPPSHPPISPVRTPKSILVTLLYFNDSDGKQLLSFLLRLFTFLLFCNRQWSV